MFKQNKTQLDILVKKLDQELIARGAKAIASENFYFKDNEGTPQRDKIMNQVKTVYQTAPTVNPAFNDITTQELVKLLMLKTSELNKERGIWGEDDRLDYYEIKDEMIKKNADCVSAICHKNDLIDTKNGFMTLRVKNYGDTFNLNRNEPFRNQPIAAGWLCTGFLVAEDIIATAGHCSSYGKATDLRFIFDFKMLDISTPNTLIQTEKIYSGKELIHQSYNRIIGSDWALIKLDRKVTNQTIVKLSKKTLNPNQQTYILGHPCGLPLKYSAGAHIRHMTDNYFSADLNVYCGNSGSPVFCKESHEVLGIAVRGDNQDFRWTGEGWLSIIYPNASFPSNEPQCTRVSEFIRYCQ